MNFEEMEKDIESVKKSAEELVVIDDQSFEDAKKFSQSVSHINIWLEKLKAGMNEANKIVTRKCDEYDRKAKKAAVKHQTMPEVGSIPGASVTPVTVATPTPPAPKPTLSLDDFDEATPSEEDLLTAELQKTLF